MAKQHWQKPGHYNKADRAKMKKSDFAGPGTSFPIQTQHDVTDAAKLAGHSKNPNAVRHRIEEIASRKGFSIPKRWQNK